MRSHARHRGNFASVSLKRFRRCGSVSSSIAAFEAAPRLGVVTEIQLRELNSRPWGFELDKPQSLSGLDFLGLMAPSENTDLGWDSPGSVSAFMC